MKRKVGIINYKLNNLSSIYYMIKNLNHNPLFLDDTNHEVDILIIPGVGSYSHGIKELKKKKFDKMIFNHIEKGKTLIAICLGFQFLFEQSYEFGLTDGLGIIKGRVIPFGENCNKVNIGWGKVLLNEHNKAIPENLINEKYFYHVHSFHAEFLDNKKILSYSFNNDYKFPSAACFDNVYGFQFHPEKSGEDGKQLLKHILDK